MLRNAWTRRARLPILVGSPTFPAMLVVDDTTALSWRRFSVFFAGTILVAGLAGIACPAVLGDEWGVPFGMLLSLTGAALLFRLSFGRLPGRG